MSQLGDVNCILFRSRRDTLFHKHPHIHLLADNILKVQLLEHSYWRRLQTVGVPGSDPSQAGVFPSIPLGTTRPSPHSYTGRGRKLVVL